MKISVVVCTYNRCESLAKALDSLALSVPPESVEWEVLVVDNNSSDKTREVIEGFCRRYSGRFRYLFEARQGKSYALNAAICEAQGDILAFTDDDVTVEPTWLRNLTAPLQNSIWVGTGGRTFPEKNFSAPRWLGLKDRYWQGPLGIFDLGAAACEIVATPFGNNMAYRKEIFGRYGGFRTDLGPRPGSEIRNEDTEFGQRLLSAGERLWYEPSAVVYHSTPEGRVQKAYFLKWWFDKARADIRQLGIPPETRWFVTGIPLFLFRRLAVWTLRWLVAIAPARRFSNKVNVWTYAGQIQECYQQAAANAPNP